jgi:hypothetical protein
MPKRSKSRKNANPSQVETSKKGISLEQPHGRARKGRAAGRRAGRKSGRTGARSGGKR